jgi:hypothetical protein
MSWLSELWNRIKGDRTDLEVAFEVVVARLSRAQRYELSRTLYAVQFAVDLAGPQEDPRVKIAREWVGGALHILESRL